MGGSYEQPPARVLSRLALRGGVLHSVLVGIDPAPRMEGGMTCDHCGEEGARVRKTPDGELVLCISCWADYQEAHVPRRQER